MKHKEDRRILRTKQALQDALIALILDKGYEDISVQDIVERANVGRSTFYSHYSGKDAVFSDSFRPLESSLERSMQRTDAALNSCDPDRLKFTGSLFLHVDKHRNLYRALTGKRGGNLATSHIRRILFDLVRRDFETRPRRANFSNTQRDATVHFVVGAITGVLSWWLDQKTGWSSGEVDVFLTSMIAPGLRNIFGEESSASQQN